MRNKIGQKDPIASHDLLAYWDRHAGEYQAGPHTGYFRGEHGHFTGDRPHAATREEFNKLVHQSYGLNAIVRVIYGPNDSDMVSACGVMHAAHT